MRQLLFALVLLSAGLAGCIGADDAASPEPQAEATGDSPGLDEVPSWQVGDWWKIRLEPGTEREFTITRVVAAVEDDAYVVGVPTSDWEEHRDKLPLKHVPGLGEVRKSNLSYDIHDRDFTPVDFPLQGGKTWQTSFDGEDVEATASPNPDGTVEIHYCCGENVTTTYDPEVGAVTSLETRIAHYEVVDHGTGYVGEVTVPRGQDIVFFQGVAAGAIGMGLEPHPPVETVEIPDHYDRMSFFLAAGPLDVADRPASGVYAERVEAPDGSTYKVVNGPTETERTLQQFVTSNVAGTWTLEHVAPGPGYAFSEGVAYEEAVYQLGTEGDTGPEGSR